MFSDLGGRDFPCQVPHRVTESQGATAAARMANLKRGGDRTSEKSKVSPDTLLHTSDGSGVSRVRAAKLF
jgi:hypothetical protein